MSKLQKQVNFMSKFYDKISKSPIFVQISGQNLKKSQLLVRILSQNFGCIGRNFD